MDLTAVDDLGRNCFHHAAAVGNTLGLQYIVKYQKYKHERAT